MNKRASRRRKADQRIARPKTMREAPTGPVRIPGVHIGHFGGASATVEPIRAYWQARGAVFMHHSLEPTEPQSRLEEMLARSHIVFLADASASAQLDRSLRRYCERTAKPLILLEENNMSGLMKALEMSLSVN
jgi:hypothetical protein